MTLNPMDLTGKHILVTGASSGIGRQTAITASRLGARLSLMARNRDRLAETMAALEGDGHASHVFDLTNLGGIADVIKGIVADSGPLDGLVNSAGVGELRPLRLSNPDFLDKVFRINFFPFVELVRCAGNRKHSNPGASFVGISSVAAFRGARAQGAYAASKAAIDAVVRPMAKELADRRVRVNAAAFGMIHTEMYQNFLDVVGSDEALASQYLGVGQTEDAAHVICFLLSDASRFVTGSTLIADGGFLS